MPLNFNLRIIYMSISALKMFHIFCILFIFQYIHEFQSIEYQIRFYTIQHKVEIAESFYIFALATQILIKSFKKPEKPAERI